MRPQVDDLDPRFNKTFLEHLEDLRKTVIWSFATLAISVMVTFPFAPDIFQVMLQPLLWAGFDAKEFVKIITVGGGFGLALRISLWGGALISFPVLTIILSRFIVPALFRSERLALFWGFGAAILLFLGGCALCYFFVLDMAIRVMVAADTWMGMSCDFLEGGDYASFVLKMLLGFGLSFELPVVLVLLGKLGVITSTQLREGRRYAIVIILTVAAILTPPDVFTQIVMAIPMIILYEICVWVVYWQEKSAGRIDLSEGLPPV